jgi:hypothetical protein
MFRMAAPVQFLIHHPYAILSGIVLAEQVGVPLPSVPVLLAAERWPVSALPLERAPGPSGP